MPCLHRQGIERWCGSLLEVYGVLGKTRTCRRGTRRMFIHRFSLAIITVHDIVEHRWFALQRHVPPIGPAHRSSPSVIMRHSSSSHRACRSSASSVPSVMRRCIVGSSTLSLLSFLFRLSAALTVEPKQTSGVVGGAWRTLARRRFAPCRCTVPSYSLVSKTFWELVLLIRKGSMKKKAKAVVHGPRPSPLVVATCSKMTYTTQFLTLCCTTMGLRLTRRQILTRRQRD